MPQAPQPFADNSFRFYVSVDGINLVTHGAAYEYIQGQKFYITPIGTLTQGLVYGQGDFWQYWDLTNQKSITWTMVQP